MAFAHLAFFSFSDDTWAIGAYRLNPDGSQDGSFGGAGYKVSGRMAFAPGYLIASHVVISRDGSIIVAGSYFDNVSKNYSPMLMRFFNDSIPTAIVTPMSGLTTSEIAGTFRNRSRSRVWMTSIPMARLLTRLS